MLTRQVFQKQTTSMPLTSTLQIPEKIINLRYTPGGIPGNLDAAANTAVKET